MNPLYKGSATLKCYLELCIQPLVVMVKCACWLVTTMTTTLERQPMTIITMTEMNLGLEEWRCVLEGGMARCVMTPGTIKLPLWSADNWDSHLMVSMR
ncbi:MAG: hypothetical protein A6F71_10010 [Cycloclasticus sp. symbiont of Poecilosclerida sp. M]|nr:MAG: hypothetical protein A6F71_10010 [Cycloclasticus sp. symbiont of Poecilosclerida sp. M]